MNLTVRFSNPLFLAIFSAAILTIGWAIGARWGHSGAAACALFGAVVALLIHDAAMTLVAGMTAYRTAIYIRDNGRKQ